PPQLGVRRLAATAVLLSAGKRRRQPGRPDRQHLHPHPPDRALRDSGRVFAQSFYPFSRFTRVEMGVHFSSIDQAILQQDFLADRFGNRQPIADPVTISGASVSYYGPQLALAHDNSLFGWVGPFAGSRWRLE